jgi:DNA-binding NtrC family response regulator
MARILIVEDDSVSREVLKAFVTSIGHEGLEAETGGQGLAMVKQGDMDLVLLDIKMPGMDGIQVLKEIKKTSPRLPVIMVTAMDRAESAIEAMRFGAYDYLTKPATRGALEKVVVQALEASRLMRVPVEFEEAEAATTKEERIIGRSPAMWQLYKQIGQVAATDATVLISGESGSG